MRTNIRFTNPLSISLGLLLSAFALPALAQPTNVAERVAALKTSLAASQTALKAYEWMETTAISLKGEEKSRQMNRCYHGADGGIQKVPVTTPPPPEEKKRGLRARVAENKKEEMTDVMRAAVALVKSYVPPTPAQIQSAKDQGKASVDLLEPGKRVRLNFRDYLKSGDTLGLELELTSNRLLGLSVKSHLDSPGDTVTLDVRYASLADGTSYADSITLEAPTKELRVQVDTSGYRKTR